MNQKEKIAKVLGIFALYWLTTGIGVLLGGFLPDVLVLPISILTIILMVVMLFMRSRKHISYTFAYLIALLLGLSLRSTLELYAGEIGLSIIFQVLGTAVILFVLFGTIGYFTKRNLSGLGNVLFYSLLGLIIFSLITLIVPAGNIIGSFIGVVIFVGYTLYDFNRLVKDPIEDKDIPFIALSLYLDFLNLFSELLELVFYASKIFG